MTDNLPDMFNTGFQGLVVQIGEIELWRINVQELIDLVIEGGVDGKFKHAEDGSHAVEFGTVEHLFKATSPVFVTRVGLV